MTAPKGYVYQKHAFKPSRPCQGESSFFTLRQHLRQYHPPNPPLTGNPLACLRTNLSSLASIALQQPRDELDVFPSIDQDGDRHRRDRIVCIHPSRRRGRHDTLFLKLLLPLHTRFTGWVLGSSASFPFVSHRVPNK